MPHPDQDPFDIDADHMDKCSFYKKKLKRKSSFDLKKEKMISEDPDKQRDSTNFLQNSHFNG